MDDESVRQDDKLVPKKTNNTLTLNLSSESQSAMATPFCAAKHDGICNLRTFLCPLKHILVQSRTRWETEKGLGTRMH